MRRSPWQIHPVPILGLLMVAFLLAAVWWRAGSEGPGAAGRSDREAMAGGDGEARRAEVSGTVRGEERQASKALPRREPRVAPGGLLGAVERGVTAGEANDGGDLAVLGAFDAWLVRWRGSGQGAGMDGTLRAEGVDLARRRREVLRRWIPENPRAALAVAVPYGIRQSLPADIVQQLEEVVSGRGDWDVLCVWRMPGRAGNGAPYRRTFTVDGRVFQAFVSGRRETQGSVCGLALHGVAVDDLLAVAESPLRVLEASEAEAVQRGGNGLDGAVCAVTGRPAALLAAHGDTLMPLADAAVAADLNRKLASTEPGFLRVTEPPSFGQWSHGVKRLLFMRVRFPDDVREPISEAEAAEVMRLANEYFVAASFNNLGLISTIAPLVMLPQPKLYYAVRGPGVLLADARIATREVGYEPDTYDLDMVRFENVPGFDWGGLGSVGGKGVWLQSSGLGVICHELGHNLGLAHANFWNTVRPEPPDNPQNLPFDADSLVGLDSRIGPGDDVEYGDPFDVMGSGGGLSAHFTGLHKFLLGWLPEAAVLTVTTSGVYRVHAHDAGLVGSGAVHVLRVRKDVERQYWIDARARPFDNPWLSRGVELHWNNWHQAIATCQLLDTTPGTRHGRDDAALTVGRMFSDEAAEVHFTPIRRGTEVLGGVELPYYDVAIRFGAGVSNRPPELELLAAKVAVAVNEPVQFSALASDEDGDELAFAWDFGEGIPGENQPAMTWAWDRSGEYVVRCEASDGRGGRAARHVVVRVGVVSGLRIQGRVVDQAGRPLLGVRVHNGLAGTNSPYAPEYRWADTDSEGRYTITGLRAGSYEVGAVLGGYDIRPLNFSRPLVLNQFTGVEVDFIAATLPRVRVAAVADGDEGAGRAAQVRIERSGPTNGTLRVYFRTAGSATPGEDYEPWGAVEVQTNQIPTVLDPVNQELELGYIDLGPGLLSTNLGFRVQRDSEEEGDETLVVTLGYPVTRTVATETETNVFDIPGWEVLADNGRDAWFQTRPRYHLVARDEATVRIRDSGPVPPTRISIVAAEAAVSENAGDSASFLIVRSGQAPGGTLRIPVVVSGSARAGDDYEALPAWVSLAPGDEAVRLTVRVLEDQFVEGNESVTVSLEDGAGYVVQARSATLTLVDNDLPWVTVAVVDPWVTERGGTGRVTFQRTGDLGEPMEVDYLLGGTAQAGADYVALPGRAVIPAGAASVTVDVIPIDDALREGDETVEVLVGDSPVYNVVRPARGTVTLLDDEFPTVTVETVDDEAIEGNDDPGVWVIRRTGSTAEALEVRYRFGGSAQHQADFIAIGDRMVIPAGQVQVTLTAVPIDDGFREDPETIAIELMEGPGYRLGSPSRAGVTLLDNDDAELAVGFALLSTRGLESKTDPELVVRMSGNPDEGPENAVTVAWEVLGGTATLGDDYVVTNGTLTFEYEDPEGETPYQNRIGTIPLRILDDRLAESDESFLIRLRIAATEIPAEDPEAPPTLVTNGLLDVYTVHTYTIVDDDASEVTVAAAVGSTAEGSATPGLFEIRRTGRTNLAQTVIFDLSGLATAGSDYLEVPRTVTLLPGQTSHQVAIVAVDDPVAEYRENVRLTLLAAPGARLGTTRFADLFLDDNDGTLEFAVARLEVLESAGEARVTVVRTGDTNRAATVLYEVGGGTATPVPDTGEVGGSDYWPTNGLLRFAPGERFGEFRVRLVDDAAVEEAETVRMGLSLGSGLFPLGGQNRAVLTILDDDALVGTGTNVTAGIESELEVVVRLERTGPLEAPLRVDFETQDRSATAGLDYEATVGTVFFATGERQATLRIPLLDDGLIEGPEGFALVFRAITGERVGEVGAAIVDDDCAVEFATAGVSVDEDAGVVELLVRRVGAPLNPVVVDYEAVSGTAREGDDFAVTRGSLRFEGNRFETLTNGTGEVVFREGETNRLVTVPIVNDADGERDEVFEVRLANVRSGLPGDTLSFVTLGSTTNAQVVIRDNEAPGRVDDAFHPGLGADGSVRALGLQADGKVVVGGEFATFDGVVMPRLVRLHADGFVDQSFNTGRGLDGSVLAVGEADDGRLWVGGTFARVDGEAVSYLVRLEPDGTRSATGQVTIDGPVRAVVGGTPAYVGGLFSRVNGETRSGVARLEAGGRLDATFVPEGSETRDVRALAASSEGGVWVGGAFEEWAGSGARYLVRLQGDGRADRSFSGAFSPDGPVEALARAADGSVIVGGRFTRLGGLPRAGLARLLPSGGMDGSFDPGSGGNGTVLSVAAARTGGTILGGAFDQFAEVPVGRFLRLNEDGTGDDTFFRGAGANDTVRVIAVQPNGAILLGGDFTEINGRPRFRLARIHAEEKYADGFVEFESAVWEGSERGGEVEIRVVRVGSSKTEATVAYRTEAMSALEGVDFERATGRLVFSAGQTAATFRVRVRDDAIPEGDETVALVLEGAEGAELGRRSAAELVIADDESAVGWSRVRAEVAEDAGEVRLTVRRSGSPAGEGRVRVATRDAGARAGEDYVPVDGEWVFAPGVASQEVVIRILNDTAVEGTEAFEVLLSEPAPGLALGSQSVIRVGIGDDDRLPSEYVLTVQPSVGGIVVPAGGRFRTNGVVTVTAVPERGFEFSRWEGTIASSDNPLDLRMDRNHVIVARFRPRSYLETFETGSFDRLPWGMGGERPWVTDRGTASAGEWSARSGAVADGGVSILRLERETPAGGGSFDYRTETEFGWDYLEFWVNGDRRQRWSGVNGWQTYVFHLPEGRNRMEWRFVRDRTFGGTEDAVWIDNLDLPEEEEAAEPPRLRWVSGAVGCEIEITGVPGRLYRLEASTDLVRWQVVASVVSTEDRTLVRDPECGSHRIRYYRVISD